MCLPNAIYLGIGGQQPPWVYAWAGFTTRYHLPSLGTYLQYLSPSTNPSSMFFFEWSQMHVLRAKCCSGNVHPMRSCQAPKLTLHWAKRNGNIHMDIRPYAADYLFTGSEEPVTSALPSHHFPNLQYIDLYALHHINCYIFIGALAW